ncbi:hypothetical protein AAFF_G00284270 [Aldrovandia affinis]|uniref:Uncharacterized protein n=1 Tax=Aldrovandia affinis TaxID=143900 RepID=A0AAD7TA70_9TELE|nr:hypothetical protein AAFF_G00284270 [Aldrovandia affinis]
MLLLLIGVAFKKPPSRGTLRRHRARARLTLPRAAPRQPALHQVSDGAGRGPRSLTPPPRPRLTGPCVTGGKGLAGHLGRFRIKADARSERPGHDCVAGLRSQGALRLRNPERSLRRARGSDHTGGTQPVGPKTAPPRPGMNARLAYRGRSANAVRVEKLLSKQTRDRGQAHRHPSQDRRYAQSNPGGTSAPPSQHLLSPPPRSSPDPAAFGYILP